MYKPLLQAILALLFTISAMAQHNFTYRKLYPDQHNPGRLLDSSQIRLLQTRQHFTELEFARIKDSIKSLSAKNTFPRSSTSKTTFNTRILSNSCGTRASFTPANDTTLYTGQAISFTNTSQNADSYEWFNDVYNRTTGTDFNNFVPAVGVTQIMLVAHRGDCADTAVTYVVNNGTPPADPKRMITTYGLPTTNEWANCIAQAKTDGYLLAGVSGVTDQNFYTSPYFVRVSEAGCILWSKTLHLNYESAVQSVIATYDDGFVAQVLLRGTSDTTYLVKFDKGGNILWAKYYDGFNDLNWIGTLREMSDHSLMVLSGQYNGGNFLLTSLDEQGGVRWQKKYSIDMFFGEAYFTDLVEKNGSLWVAGNYIQAKNPNMNEWFFVPMLFKVDVATGNLQWFKGYTSPDKLYTWSGIHFYKDGLIMYGNADSLVVPNNSQWNNFESLLETDLDGNIREGKLIYNTTNLDARFGDNLFVNADNSLSLFYSGVENMNLQPGFADRAYYLRLDAGKNILWQNQYFGYTVGLLAQAAPTPAKGLAMIGQRMNSLSSPFYGFSENLVLVKVDSNGRGPDAQCDMYETFTTVQDMLVTPYTFNTVIVTNELLQAGDVNADLAGANSELRYNCPDYVPLCSFMKLSGQHVVCNLKDTFDFIAHKDPSCADPITWTYDNVNIKTTYQDGGKRRLIFNTPGVYKIRAEKPFPCADIADSIMVTVAPGLLDFTLGNDTTICTGDSLVLKPPGRYNVYLWQDGSTNDSFIVKTAGDYQLTVTDSCGNTKPDMIHVDFKTSIPIDLGGTRNICPTDSVFISPPVGMNPFNWTPVYNMLPTPDGAMVFFPRKDTVYTLDVFETGGCKRSGQLTFKVFPSTNFSLGNDTAFCAGGVAGFSAGTGFSSYTWSNGSIADFIIVKDPGQYSVTATDPNGCRWRDTVSLTVYPPPAVKISGGTVICKDQSLMLDAGSGFANYLWQDGTAAETYSVVDTGFYRVQVTDLHQCSGADSIHIESFAESPRQFLPSDTIVCSYLGVLIQPNAEFAQYSWSTGETGKSIQVKTAGKYVCRVVNQDGCPGTDSIRIDLKDCEALLVFPNAFTPNHDGLNDVFRLKYPGHAADYNLQIFNRWGQKIFETSDTSLGWDGNLNNQLQPEGNYIWIVHYTDNSGKKQKLQGSVVLIR